MVKTCSLESIRYNHVCREKKMPGEAMKFLKRQRKLEEIDIYLPITDALVE